ncbi:MAG: uncharacterized protein QOH61_2367 [Chloroflexota bacterium]|jgi:uncharacterized protein with von Willebrand factor type A (vWA) domain|nr:uncharacterized protein [Chloroflexota bacterium]
MTTPISGTAFLRNVLDFGRELRREGMTADLAAVLDYTRALQLVDIGDREEVRAAGAALFVRRRDEIEPYERAFARFWRARRKASGNSEMAPANSPQQDGPEERAGTGSPRASDQLSLDVATPDEGDAPDAPEGEGASPMSWSANDALRQKAFERMTGSELREAERAIDLMTPTLPLRRTRRWELGRRGTLLAPREMLRQNLSSGGDLVQWVWRKPRKRPRSVVLLCDISGSMERYSRLLLRFGHAMSRSNVRMEAFAFGTRLTRITPMLRRRDPDVALREVSDAVGDWSGGTRIGVAFREFNQDWARRVLRTSGIVIVVSDGWDRGDPALVGTETARLQRNCHLLVWLNPLAGSAGYRPLAQGMAAAYPHVDRFLPCHDLTSLHDLATILARDAFPVGRRGPGGVPVAAAMAALPRTTARFGA